MKEAMAQPERTERQLKIENLEREISDLDHQAQRASSPATYDWLTHRIERLASENLRLIQQEQEYEEAQNRETARHSESIRRQRGRLSGGPWMTAILFIMIGIVIGSIAMVILGIVIAPVVIAWTKGKVRMEEASDKGSMPHIR